MDQTGEFQDMFGAEQVKRSKHYVQMANKMTKEIQKLQSEKNLLKQAFEDQKQIHKKSEKQQGAQILKLSSILLESQAIVDQLKIQNNKLAQDISQTNLQMSKYKEENETHLNQQREKTQKLNERILQLQKQIQVMSKNDELKEKLESSQIQKKQLKEELSKLTERIETLSGTIQERGLQIQSLSSKVTEKQVLIVHLQSQKEELTQRIQLQDEQKSKGISMYDSLKLFLDQKEQQLQLQSKQLDVLRLQKQNNNSLLTSDLEKYIQEVEDLKACIQNLRNQINQKNEQVGILESQVQLLKQHQNSSKQEDQCLKTQNMALIVQVNALTQQNDVIKQQRQHLWQRINKFERFQQNILQQIKLEQSIQTN